MPREQARAGKGDGEGAADGGDGRGDEDREGEPREVSGGPVGGPVGLLLWDVVCARQVLCAECGVFPGVEAEAVEGADAAEEDGGGEQVGADPVGG